MSDVPNIFSLPSNSWGEQTAGAVNATPAAELAGGRMDSQNRLWAVAAAAISWGIVGVIAGLVWYALA